MSDRSEPSDRIEVRFATFREQPGDGRARFAAAIAELTAGERVLVDTCHRVELVSVDADATAPAANLRGIDAVRRVFEVVAGFDSAVVAEEQLLGQIRGAYEEALAAGRSGPILNELMRRALRFGRLVRSHARPGTERSLADPAVAWLRERLRAGDRVLVAGTGEMGRLLAHSVAEAGHPVTLLSSSAERGGRILESLPHDGHRLSVGPVRPDLIAGCEGMALAVRGREPALRADHLPVNGMPWVIDLSAPSAVAPDAADQLGDHLLGLDQLGMSHAGTPVLTPAAEARLRRQLGDEVDAYLAWLESRRGADALAILHGEADAVRRRHVERLRRRGALDAEQIAAVDAASAAMLGDLLHGPTVELRHGGADADTVRRLFRIEA